jgi:hypothetical protein
MMKHVNDRGALRLVPAALLGAGLCLAVMPRAAASGRNGVLDQLREQLVAEAVSVSGPADAGRIEIFIERWSTDEEMDTLRRPLQQNAASRLLPALQQQRRAGVVLMPGVQGHGARARTRTPRVLLFAREIKTADGRRLIAASDEHLGLGETGLEARRSIAEFNLIDIRFGPNGTGIGKVGVAGDVAFSEATKTLEVGDYAARPTRLIDVRSQKQ